jgi:hypothetical protein
MLTAIFFLALGLFALVALPIIVALGIVFLVLKLILGLVLFPFRLLGWMVTGAIATVFTGAVVLVLLGVVLLPLLPVFLLAGIAYLLYRLIRPARIVTT